jgi:hypothetical protein
MLALTACPDRGGEGGDEDGPPASEACPAACENFKACADDSASFDQAGCVQDCQASASFLDMNNPGSGCGDAYLGLSQCQSELSCEDLDRYFMEQDAPDRPCKAPASELEPCAIE